VRLRLVSYAARVFSSLPRTTVYLDAGAVDWLVHLREAVSLLKRAGVEHTRGFVVGGTHYSGTSANIKYGKRLVKALAHAGVRGKHFVVDTADNSHPFTGVWYRKHHPHGDFNNAEPCRTAGDRHCVALGIPPTSHVTAARFGFSDKVTRIARNRVDAFVWEARPWLDPKKQHLDRDRTLAIARTSPY
jgi:endoglucanase